MPTGDARSGFRRWRRCRPFWGGLFLLLSALELFASANLTLQDLQVHFGQEGYLSYVLPAVLVLCGALAWASPAQRLFYGVLGLLTALYSFLGLNLGGFGLGMLLGIIGGALTIAWGPPRKPPEADEDGERDGDITTEPEADGIQPAGGRAEEIQPAGGGAEEIQPIGYETPDIVPGLEARPNVRRPGRGAHRKLLVIMLVPLAVTATVLVGGGRTPARADTCPEGVPTQPGAAARRATTPAAKPAATPSSPAPSPAPTAESGNPIVDGWNRFAGGVGRLLGIGGSASPTPAPSASPTTTPTPVTPQRSRPASRADVPCLGPRVLGKRASPRGVPIVTSRGARLEGRSLEMYNSTYDGTANVPTANGPLRTLKFSMAKSVTKPFSLTVPEPDGRTTVIRSNALTTQGHVTFYTPSFEGKLFGLIPVRFTPDSPPPLTLPYLEFTDVRITLTFVRCDRLTADPLDLTETA